MKAVSFPTLSSTLITLAALFAIAGVLVTSPLDIIDRSFMWNDGPGVIIALFNPSQISDFISFRNKALMSLVLVVIGWFAGLPSLQHRSLSARRVVIICILFLILAVLIAGRTRQYVIASWQSNECKIHWFVDLLSEQKFQNEYLSWSGRGQGNDFLKDSNVYFAYMRSALNAGISPNGSQSQDKSYHEVNDLREDLRSDLENTTVFYYLFHPVKLVLAYM